MAASATLAGIVAAHVLLETARDALFLTKLGPQALPFVYIVLAAFGFLAARADHFIARFFGRQNALVLGLMGAATGTMLFYTESMNQTQAFALYLWTGVITTLLTVQFWLSMGQRITPAQGRRLYGLLAAGGVFGGVAGAGFGAVLAERFSIQALLPAAAGLHLLTAWLATIAPPATLAPMVAPRMRMTQRLGEVRHDSYLVRVALLMLTSAATLLFVRSPASNYIFDEQEALLANPYVNGGDLGFWQAFKRDFWGLPPERSIGSYRPIPNLIWRLLWHVSELPWLHHWVNVVLHAVNAAVLASFAFALTKKRGFSWLCGAVFVSSAVYSSRMNCMFRSAAG